MSKASNGKDTEPGVSSGQVGREHICEVWAHNLEEEMSRICDIVDKYPYIAMDTEFPGVVVRPVGPFRDGPDYNYQRIKHNVDLLKVIQIGLTFCDESGRLPTDDGTYPYSTWQFNFMFDLCFDIYAADSVQFLQNCGVNFEHHQQQGIDVNLFGELLMSSGIVLNENVTWIAFQGKYDFAYLIKVLTCDHLPNNHDLFFDLLHTYFPKLYDIKWLVHYLKKDSSTSTANSSRYGDAAGMDRLGLEELGLNLGVSRVGQAHQAGSDSLLTAKVFFSLSRSYLPQLIGSSSGEVGIRDNHGGGNLEKTEDERNGSLTSMSEGETSSASEELNGHKKQKVRNSLGNESNSSLAINLANILHGLGKGYLKPERDSIAVMTGTISTLPSPAFPPLSVPLAPPPPPSPSPPAAPPMAISTAAPASSQSNNIISSSSSLSSSSSKLFSDLPPPPAIPPPPPPSSTSRQATSSLLFPPVSGAVRILSSSSSLIGSMANGGGAHLTATVQD